MKILVLKFGDPILDYVNLSLLKLGHETRCHEGKTCSLKDIQSSVESFRPDFCLVNNLDLFMGRDFGDELEAFFLKHSVPVVSWFFESPTLTGGLKLLKRWKTGPFPKGISFLVTDSYYLSFFRERGLKAAHLPLGVRPDLFEWTPGTFEKYPVSFAGSPFFQFVGELPDLKTDELIQKFYMGYLLDEFQRRCGVSFPADTLSMQVRALEEFFSDLNLDSVAYENIRKNLMKTFKESLSPGLFEELELYESRIDVIRSFFVLTIYLRALLTAGIRIYGGENWKPFFSDYAFETHKLSDQDLLNNYHFSRISFCQTKSVFHHFVHDRVPAILAVGGFPLIDHRADLDLMFEKNEVASYRSLDEAKTLIDYFLKHESERDQIIQRGRARVQKEHTYFHRTQKILHFAKNDFGIGTG